MKFIRDLWRGDVPLVWTYWGFGVVVTIMLVGLFAVVENNLSRFDRSAALMTTVIALFVFAMVYTVFVWIAIWRSANHYAGWHGWRILAKVAVVLGILSSLGSLAKLAEPARFDNSTLAETAATLNKGLPKMIEIGRAHV